MSFLIYGASGYTGKLIVERCIKKGLHPVVAGRSEEKIKLLAAEYGLKFLVFSLDNVQEISKYISPFTLVLNCAGPFSKTAKPMVEACLKSKTHYLDITGELTVFEMVKSYHKQAIEEQVLLMPGVGFDVVPTDCMAAYLHNQMPDATHLELAFMSIGGGISHGTMSTMVENLGMPGAVRENGKIVSKPVGHKSKMVSFGRKPKFTMTIPWGDVSTAFHTTGIPNIEVYTAVPKKVYNIMKLQSLFNPLLKGKFVKKLLQNYIDKKISGPTEEQLQKGKALVWGKVQNENGDTKEALLEAPEGYVLTAEMSIQITQKLINGNIRPGYHTPAGLFGHELILEIPDTKYL
jgi:short subunit dehydrogenase-like uncharacterized protein